MDAAAKPAQPRFLRWLPYWAVLQTDLRQTLRGWVWRTWVLTTLLAAVGYMCYRLGVYREAGIVQHASVYTGDLLRWPLLGTALLVVVLTVGSITSERGTLADAVLSRGISRYQYFMAKWHSRLATVLATFTLLTGGVLLASHFLLHEDVSLDGSLVALAAMAGVLTVIVTTGVTAGAMTGSTVLGVSVVWLLLYGAAFGLSFLPSTYPTPDRMLMRLPQILQGAYDVHALTRLIGASFAASGGLALVGLVGFARADV